MRKLITGMKISVDGMIAGPDGYADWVDAWSDEYGLARQIDACIVGGGMYPGYEQYWSAIQNEPHKVLQMTGKFPSQDEVEWSRFAAQTPHYVVSTTLTQALWPKTMFLRNLDEVAALKRKPGKDIYLMGGAHITAGLIEAGLVDEMRLLVYPLIAGLGKALFATIARRQALELTKAEPLQDGRVSLIYNISRDNGVRRAGWADKPDPIGHCQ